MTDNTSAEQPPGTSSTNDTTPAATALTSIELAARGLEVTGLDIYDKTSVANDQSRVEELMAAMHADVPKGGTDMPYGKKDTQCLRLWKPDSDHPPIIVFVHGGSWCAGTYLDSIGSAKIGHLLGKGYAVASINYSLIPEVTVAEQVQEVADSVGYLAENAIKLGIDAQRVVLMGHSSGAHIVTLLGTDTGYFVKSGVSIDTIRGVISLDGSNFNAAAELIDNPGNIAQNMTIGLGTDLKRLQFMSPVYHAQQPNAKTFLILQVQRQGDVRQAIEFAAVLNAAGTKNALHVFEGSAFEGHMAMLLRLGDVTYPATLVMDKWLDDYFPVV
ncbi:hypothetical protein CLIM01_14937 [Colletotrichum limetticola]|uniref:BD-FAE-like domain-containing protein n=1 Tax=Colletotrichum limetticola TaxID=1209924 RepID=A0ABQ9P7V8_9PEZI|nr:hypothetical protein CLIM01_14937 [Colletotrichum limetticola]